MKLKWNVIALVILFCTLPGWGQSSSPLSLKDCIRIALENNVSVQTNENLSKIASNNYLASYSDILPTVSSSFSASRTTIGPSEFLDQVPVGFDSTTGDAIYETRVRVSDKLEFNSHRANVTVNQNIFDGGRWWNNIRQGKANKNAAEYNFLSETNSTITTVAQNYIDLLKQEKLLEVNELMVQRSQDNLNRSQKMFEIGSVAKVDVFRARGNLGRDRITMINQRNQVHRARQRLNISLGRAPNTPLEIAKDYELDYSLPALKELTDRAFDNQPELRRQEMRVRSDELDVSLAKSAFVPRVSAFFSYNRDNDELKKLYTSFDRNWSTAVGINVNFNLFNGFQDMVNHQNAKIDLKNTRLALEDYKRQLTSDISVTYQNYKDLVEIVEINETNLEAAQEEYRLANERYRLGSGTSLDVRESQVSLTDAERILVAAKYDLISTYARLMELVGNGQNAF